MEGRNWSMYVLAIDVDGIVASKDLWGSIYIARDV